MIRAFQVESRKCLIDPIVLPVLQIYGHAKGQLISEVNFI